MKQLLLVLDFGGQYKELIARMVRGFNVHSEIKAGSISAEEIKRLNPIGIILTGGPNSVCLSDSPKCDPKIFNLGIPVLGICYGMQIMCRILGGQIEPCTKREYGKTTSFLDEKSILFSDMEKENQVLMSHTDLVRTLPEGFKNTGRTCDCANASCENSERKLYGVQFHPEANQTYNGKKIVKNFLYKICGAKGDYLLNDYIDVQIKTIRKKVGDEKVLLALSGGVDSSVCASLLLKAIPNQLVCIFVDHGFMRLNEGDAIESIFSKRNLHFIRVNAQKRFISKIKGVTNPEKKRKIIGEEFARVFEEESKKLGNIKFLAQGTIYPDIIESGGEIGAKIKSHHNVGGLPENLAFSEVIEPLSGLFKDEVRVIGRKLGLPSSLVDRQPFPGPGLAIRIIGKVTNKKIDVLRQADHILCEEISKLKNKPQQYFAVCTDTCSVGVQGDSRTYNYVIALRAVTTSDFMTCDYTQLPHKILGVISSRITNEVKGVNRIVYDITSKPPATVEWE